MPHSRGRFVYIREISDRLISGPRIRKLGVLEDVEALARVGPLHPDISEWQGAGGRSGRDIAGITVNRWPHSYA